MRIGWLERALAGLEWVARRRCIGLVEPGAHIFFEDIARCAPRTSSLPPYGKDHNHRGLDFDDLAVDTIGVIAPDTNGIQRSLL